MNVSELAAGIQRSQPTQTGAGHVSQAARAFAGVTDRLTLSSQSAPAPKSAAEPAATPKPAAAKPSIPTPLNGEPTDPDRTGGQPTISFYA